MKNFGFVLSLAVFISVDQVYGSESGMPQLDTKFWTAQIFWLILIFSSLYLIVWKIFLPKITTNIENRKSKIINDLNEAQKLKKSAEKKLQEYNKIIEDSKKEAKKIIDENKKKLDNDIEKKKQKFNTDVEKELMVAEKEIKELKKSSIASISKIASQTSAEVINLLINSEVNKSNVSAVVDEIIKRKVDKHI